MNNTFAIAQPTIEELQASVAEIVRDSFNWERKIGRMLLRTLSPDMLATPLPQDVESAEMGCSTVRELVHTLVIDDDLIERSVAETLRSLGLCD